MLCNRFDGRAGNAGVVGRVAPREFSVEEVLRVEFAGLTSSLCAGAGVTRERKRCRRRPWSTSLHRLERSLFRSRL